MKHFFSWDGPLLRFFDKVGKVMIASMLWLLTSIPIVTTGLASTALYYSVVKAIRNDRDYVLSQYYGALRREWKQGLLFGVLYLLAFALLLLDVIAWHEEGTKRGMLLFLICAAAMLLLAVSAVYVFSLISRFEMGFRDVLKISFFLEFRYLPSSVGIALILGTSVGLIFLSPYTVLFVPGAACFLISFLTEKIYQNIIPEPADGQEQWYDKKNKEEYDANQETV
ncbi:MAG: DUF624 domain-containing protein [Lachnospiraceae bacterium]|nr:DUF624 domain-containing protein [Lachnospiraceae bacterium]